jgi:polysaccharide pyruvyl transferase WcaK-like protein
MSWRSRPAEHILVILSLALLYRLGWRSPARRNTWLRTLLDAELVGEIRGGDSFSDIYGFRKFLIGSLPLLSTVLLRRPYVMLPQTYGPFRLSASRAIARFLLQRATTIFTRDRNCEALVYELCGRTPIFCPDVAFTLEPIKPHDLRIMPAGLELEKETHLVGVNVSGLLYMGGYTGRNMFGLRSDYRELVDQLILRILTSTDAKILLVPHVFGSEQEEEACSAILASYEKRYPGRLFAVAQPLSERELKWVIGKTSFFVGSRMHACIAALSQFVPTVGLAYSDKFLGVFESAGVGEGIVDLRTSPTPEVVDQTLSAMRRRTELRAQLKSKIPAVREAILGTFRQMVPS